MWLKAFALLIAAIMLPGTALAQDEYRQDPYGSRGDIGIELRCYGDRYVVGMTGRAGTNIDRIQLLCAKIGPDGAALPSDTKSVDVGGLGGAPTDAVCDKPKGYVTKIIVFLTNTKDQIEQIYGYCGGPVASEGPFGFGAPLVIDGYKYYREFVCPAGMALTGLTVRYGKHVNAVGPICNKLVLQPAPPAADPPPGPARTGPYVPYGAPKGTVTRPTAPSFVGSYALTSRGGRKMTFVVNQGDGNDVFGTLSSTDPLFSGQFTGTVEVGGRRLNFTYRDPATGKTGSGFLKYINGGSDAVLGGIASDGPPRVPDIWSGPRQ